MADEIEAKLGYFDKLITLFKKANEAGIVGFIIAGLFAYLYWNSTQKWEQKYDKLNTECKTFATQQRRKTVRAVERSLQAYHGPRLIPNTSVGVRVSAPDYEDPQIEPTASMAQPEKPKRRAAKKR